MSETLVNRSRRAFLLGKRLAPATPAFPCLPWVDAAAPRESCTGCGACVTACPEGIVRLGDDRRPTVDFRQGAGPCTFCAACADACPEPVFLPAATRAVAPAWGLRVAIGDGCLAHSGVMCQTCKDYCDARAVRFVYAPGRVPQPVIDHDRCTGCGACIAPCPTSAIVTVVNDTAAPAAAADV